MLLRADQAELVQRSEMIRLELQDVAIEFFGLRKLPLPVQNRRSVKRLCRGQRGLQVNGN